MYANVNEKAPFIVYVFWVTGYPPPFLPSLIKKYIYK